MKAQEILKAISDRKNELAKDDSALLALEQKKHELVAQAVTELKEELGDWPENYDEQNSDFVQMNEIDGVDFIKEIPFNEAYAGLESEIEDELCDTFCHCSIDRSTVTFTQATTEDAFLYDDRGRTKLNYLGYNEEVSSFDEALLVFEKISIDSGICGNLWDVNERGNICNINTSEYLHPSFRAFQSDDKAALKKIERALLFIEIEKDFKGRFSYMYSYIYDEIFDLVEEELEIVAIENNSELKTGKLELVVTFEDETKVTLGE